MILTVRTLAVIVIILVNAVLFFHLLSFARDGTVWKPLIPGVLVAGWLQQQNILKEAPGPDAFAFGNIDDTVKSAFKILTDEDLLRHIQEATVTEAHRQL